MDGYLIATGIYIAYSYILYRVEINRIDTMEQEIEKIKKDNERLTKSINHLSKKSLQQTIK